MLRISDELAHLDLSSLVNADEYEAFHAHVTESLELRVGLRLADSFSDEELDIFEGFVDGNLLVAVSFLNSVDESWHEHEMLVSALEGAFKDGDQAGVVCEFAADRKSVV